MCLTTEEKARLNPESEGYDQGKAWDIIYAAIEDCVWESDGPSCEGDWIVVAQCNKCGVSIGAVAGGAEVVFDAYCED